jgi:hypothetical protein
MTEQQHPITPPPEFVQHWYNVAREHKPDYEFDIATQAARWGADRELEACCHLLWLQGFDVMDDLRAARRPKPPSLKEQALKELAWVDKNLKMPLLSQCDAIHTIRRALEQLDG